MGKILKHQTPPTQDVIALAVAMAERILEKEVGTHPLWMRKNIQELLQQHPLDSVQNFTLMVNPKDHLELESADWFLALQKHLPHVSLTQNDDLKQGECMIVAPHHILDGRFRTRLNVLKTLLLG